MRPALDLSLYLVTDTALCGEVGVVATVRAAVANGVSLVQLRDPDADDAGFVALGRALVAELRGTGVPLIVNDRVHLAEAIGAAGAHVGQGDLDAAEARRVLGPDAVLGLSVQTLAHVETARGLGTAIDYLGVGPVWAQDTKPDAAPPGGLNLLRDIVIASPWPCVAIGGIGGERVAAVRRTGAAGVAVVSAICGRPDVASATAQMRRTWDEATHSP
ncbi:MAG: thiamine phosphate synthase [Kineosporiaceae bacterium]